MKLLRRSTALLLSCAIVLGLVASGFLIRAIADTAMQWYNADYDALSRFYEIGASYDPGIIATTPGDPGGKSYGMYMFASNAGVPHDFAEWCKKSDKSVYRDIGDALDSAYHRISDGYGSYFDATWQDMANTYKGTFGQAQYDYTKDKFYNKVVSLVENKVDGFDIEEYSVALKNVFWSRAVQHGPTDACSLIKRAFDSLGGFANQPEGDLISAIYAVSGRLVTAEELRSEGKSGAAMSGDTANKYGTSGLILRYFYGSDLYINTAEAISGIPASWPGEDLVIGSSGNKVRQIQEQLDAVATVYSAVPRIAADGIYGPATARAVEAFQSVFGLPVTGTVDFSTWYKISHIYVGVTRIAELK